MTDLISPTRPAPDSTLSPPLPPVQPAAFEAPAPDVPAPPLPRFAQIEPIGRCNLACGMCTVNHRGDEVATLSVERYIALLDALPGLEALHLQGLGEPMLHPRFFDMVEIAARRGIRVSANSNLTLLTPARVQRCISSGLAALSVSLDGATAATFEGVRHGANFGKVVRNLGRLTDARDAAASPLEVRGVMVLMRSNLDELPALVELLHAHRVPELLVQRLSSDLEHEDLPGRYIPIRSYCRSAELRPQDLPHAEQVFEQARQRARALGLQLNLPSLRPAAAPAPAAGSPRCSWPWDGLYFTAAGEMLPCCMVATADRASFGRVFGPEPASAEVDIPGAWNSATARQFRRGLRDDAPPSICRSCALYHGTF
ncbi:MULTISPECIES: radical SAM/SPASM domain-containing protein [Aquincola]|uniref:radical SAM protein n=1 Tax=Aquincola TaxID=391952 RepID=UPI000697BB0E|nr:MULTISPECIES: radical SAM/SPASM domain-containing protein [Aquincola]MCR5868097.1 radical SAM protein [Aquincola sp. J276]